MSSTPSSTLSSPARGVFGRRPDSRISITEGVSPFPVRPGSPTLSGANGSSTFKPKLSRRWSLDNLAPNSSREGYVKDLRRQHKAAQQSHAAMDEGYPFMVTEARRASNAARGSIGGGSAFGIMPSVSMGSGGMASGNSSGNASAGCSRPGSASPPPYQPVQNPKSIAGCKRARSYSFDEEAICMRNTLVGGRVGIGTSLQSGSTFLPGNRFIPIGGAISSMCESRGHQRLFAKNSFSSSIDISTSTPVVPEDKELPATKVTPPTRLSLGNEQLGILSETISTGCDNPSAHSRISPEMPMRISGGPFSSSSTSLASSSGNSRNPQKCKAEAYVRKRSSSLPRILPPIFDDDVDDEIDCEFAEDGNGAGGNTGSSTQKSSWKQQNLPSHQDHTSNIIVREMQKFVCRHAIDVSHVLPLPLPTSSRQSRIMQDHGRSNSVAAGAAATGPFALRTSTAMNSSFSGFNKGKYNKAPVFSSSDGSIPALDSRHARILMSTVAKVHAVSFAIKCKMPRLFDEIVTSLDLSKRTTSASLTPSSNMSPSSPSPSPTSKTFPQRPFSSNMSRKLSKTNSDEKKHQTLLDEAFRVHGSAFEIDPEKANLRMKVEQQIEDLYSPTCIVPFSVLVHGNLNINSIVFRYDHSTQSQNRRIDSGDVGDVLDTIPTDVKLPSLIHACIGSPLLDIYQVLYHCSHSRQGELGENIEKESLLFSYHASFIDVCNQLRVQVTDFGRERLDDCVEKYELAGMILAAATVGNSSNSTGSSSQIDRYTDSSSDQYHSLNLSSDGTPLNISTIEEVEMTATNEDEVADQVPLIIKKLIEAKISDKMDGI